MDRPQIIDVSADEATLQGDASAGEVPPHDGQGTEGTLSHKPAPQDLNYSEGMAHLADVMCGKSHAGAPIIRDFWQCNICRSAVASDETGLWMHTKQQRRVPLENEEPKGQCSAQAPPFESAPAGQFAPVA